MKRQQLLAYLALTFICLAWGTTYLALRIAVVHFPPFLFVMIRQVTAGLLLSGFMLTVGKAKLPPKEEWGPLAIGGLFMFTVANGVLGWAEVYIPSGIAAIICSFMPMWVVLLNLSMNRDERPTLPVFLGVSLGLLGICIVFSGNLADFANGHYLGGILIIFFGTFVWSIGSMWIKKRHLKTNLYLSVGLQMFLGGLWLLPASLLFDDYSQVHWSADAVYPMLYLIAVGSIMAYVCYFYTLKNLPITVVSLYAYVNPLVAVVLGWALVGERLDLGVGVGFLATVLGIYLVNRGYQLRNEWKAQLSR